MKAIKIVGAAMMVGGLAGCAAPNTAIMPTPVLCKEVLEQYANLRHDYNDMLVELNKRGEDCAEYAKPDQKIDIDVR
jgi:hypothetical protein